MNHRDPRLRLALFCALLIFWLPCRALAQGGIGGTGCPHGGIGGTGITAIGAIQRFGSIFVNGIEYRLRPQTRYFVDGRRASARALGLGDRVFVTAQGPLTHPTARTVRTQHVLIGRVTAADGSRFAVLGIPVRLARGAATARHFGKGAGVRPGTWVAVSGFARGPRGILATRVRIRRAQTMLLVRGRVGAQTRHHIRIRGVWLRVTGHWPRLHGVIVARGLYKNGQALLTRARPAHRLDGSRRGLVSILGLATQRNGVWRYGSLDLQPVTPSAARALRAAHGPQLAIMTGSRRGRHVLLSGFTASAQPMLSELPPQGGVPHGPRGVARPAPGHPVIPHPPEGVRPDITVMRPALPALPHIP
ncbi:MAG: DUF5666 domain-containing protein [Gammaproteobacteria bacterium]|nr:DUF5666 domain-containing protein [Gammaproteobacteria bacterium]